MPVSHDAYLGLVPSSLRFLCRARNSRGKNHLNCGMSARNYLRVKLNIGGVPLRRRSFTGRALPAYVLAYMLLKPPDDEAKTEAFQFAKF